MKSTTSKSGSAAGVVKKGLLRKLGGRVKRIFKKEKNNESRLQELFDTARPDGNAQGLNASLAEPPPRPLSADQISSVANGSVAGELSVGVPHGSSESQARAPTTAALIGLMAQATRILAEGLHDVEHQPRASSKKSSNQVPGQSLKRPHPPLSLDFLQETDSSVNTLVNNTRVNPSPSSPTLGNCSQLADVYQQVSLVAKQAWVDQVKAEAGAAEEADWVALTKWMERWCQDEAARAIQYKQKASQKCADATKREAEVSEMRIAVLAAEAANHNNLSDIEDERDHLQRLFDDLQERTESLESDWMEQRAELERSLTVEKQQRAKNFRDVIKVKREKKALEQKLAEQKEEAEEELQRRQDTIDSSLPMNQNLSQQLAEVGSINSAASVIYDLRSEVQRLKINSQNAEIQIQALHEMLGNTRVHLGSAKDTVSRAEAERKAAVLETNMVHLQNMFYRANYEDGDPARTAEIDGCLKRKDEAFEKLREIYNQGLSLLNAERLGRASDQAHFAGQKQVLEEQKVVLKKNLKSVRMNRDNIQKQNEEVFAMFKSKIFNDDVANALAKDNDILRQDNVRLISMSKKRECRLQKAIEETVTLKQKIAELDAASEDMTEKQRHLQAATNGLELHKNRLEHTIDIESAVWEGERARLQEQISLKEKELQRLLQDGCETSTWEELQTKEAEIIDLKYNLQQEQSLAAQYRDQILETRDGFCHVHNCNEVWNMNAADVRYRLTIAERENLRLQKLLDGHDVGRVVQGGRLIPLTEGQGAYYGPRPEDESLDDTITF